jgi:hypothetical protein
MKTRESTVKQTIKIAAPAKLAYSSSPTLVNKTSGKNKEETSKNIIVCPDSKKLLLEKNLASHLKNRYPHSPDKIRLKVSSKQKKKNKKERREAKKARINKQFDSLYADSPYGKSTLDLDRNTSNLKIAYAKQMQITRDSRSD